MVYRNQVHSYQKPRKNDFHNDSYIAKQQIKHYNEELEQNRNPQFRLGAALLDSDIPWLMAIGAGIIMVVAGGAGMAYHEIHDSHSHSDNHDSSPIEKMVSEPVHKEAKTRASTIDVISPKATKISGDETFAGSPLAIDENSVGHVSKLPDNYYKVIVTDKNGNAKDSFGPYYGSANKAIDTDGQTIVHATNHDLRSINLDTKEDKIIGNETKVETRDLGVSNGEVVRSVMDSYASEDKISEINIQTNEEKVLQKDATQADMFNKDGIHKMVYQGYDNKLHITDINSNITQRLNPDSTIENEGQPHIYGDYVVFLGDSNIYLKDLKSGALKNLGPGNSPELHKNLAVWETSDDIFVYNILEGKTTQIKLDGIQSNPSVFDGNTTDYVVFDHQETDFDDPSVWLVDLSPNHAPDLEQILSQKVANGAGWSGKIAASDPDGDILTTLIQGDAFKLAGDTVSLKDSYKDLPGTYMCKVTATDEHGAAKNISFNITVDKNGVITNTPPSVRNLKNITIPYGDSSKASGTLEVFDPEGDPVSLSLFNGSSAYFNLMGNQWALKKEYLTQPGTYPLEILASDGNATKEDRMSVTVKDKDNSTKPDKPIWKSPYMIMCGAGAGIGGILTTVGGAALIIRKLTKKKASA